MAGTVGKRPVQTREESRSELTGAQMAARVTALALLVTNPLATVLAAAAAIGLSRQRRLRPVVFVPLGLTLGLAGVALGSWTAYVAPWVELAGALSGTSLRSGIDLAVVGQLVGRRWPFWLAGQLPIAAGGAVLFAVLFAWRKHHRRPTWRETPKYKKQLSRGQLERAVKQTASTQARPVQDGTAWLDLTVTFAVALHDGSPVRVSMRHLNEHCYLDGAAGQGKTTLLLELAHGLVNLPAPSAKQDPKRRPAPVLFMTFKPDDEVTTGMQALAQATDRGFHYITHDGRNGGQRLDVFSRIDDPEAMSSMVVQIEAESKTGGFNEPHYRRSAERFIRLATRALFDLNAADASKWPKDFRTLARVMRPETLHDNADQFSAEVAQDWAQYAAELDARKRLRDDVDGLYQRVAAMAESGARRALGVGDDAVVLETALEAGDVIVLDLDAGADFASAELVGNLVLQDLIVTMSRLAKRRWNRDAAGAIIRTAILMIDEFGALGGTALENLLRRVRGQGAGVVLACQEAASLDVSGPTFREIVFTNTRAWMLFGQTVNAEEYSKMIGTEPTVIETSQVHEEGSLFGIGETYRSGQGNVRTGEAFIIHPQALRNLEGGQICFRLRGGGRPVLARVIQPSLPAPKPKVTNPQTGKPDKAPPESDPATELADVTPADSVDTYVSTEKKSAGVRPSRRSGQRTRTVRQARPRPAATTRPGEKAQPVTEAVRPPDTPAAETKPAPAAGKKNSARAAEARAFEPKKGDAEPVAEPPAYAGSRDQDEDDDGRGWVE